MAAVFAGLAGLVFGRRNRNKEETK
ncbi:hypothetical protein [Brochothrix thermosphacta]|nr:hypothetical protein BTH160X_140087 [Brochothrix thermosphacta]